MSVVWNEARKVIHILKQNNHNAYIVGGAVRDWLLQREIADVDIVTTATAEEVQSLFSKTFRMNNQHQTVIVRSNLEHFEVTTIRGQSIEDDLHLRDLTINSIAIDDQNELFDPTGGEVDLRAGRLRASNPADRMGEDPLRMLRVYRFVSELGFDIDTSLKEAILHNREAIQKVAVERVVKEWVKLIKGKQCNLALTGMVETKLYSFIPGLSLTKDSLMQLKKLPPLHEESDLICWTLFCLCSNYVDDMPLKRLALSNELLRGIRARLHFFEKRKMQSWLPLALYEATLDVALDVERLRELCGLPSYSFEELSRLWDELPIHDKSELAITGRDLLQSVKRPGPWVKEELRLAEVAVVTKELTNEKTVLLQALERRRAER
ncbi:CCA tRNA nucleotidyltransferase [Halalkalibacter nanhaiisediminis]|uniref:tRNA nucleotidyltransferase (CCA-adding enzyme) n=1 Tax=Halalkalibacter nanhaiisediminis TaxID=688079 RepID=A0A562QQE3_9BACI|nr:CCA tRNA nucleotidyltransferase [Halalkalibacter nanhaiisediminis]TWI58893.1 tRNA nucleotidyltransferase (CCA-adding enzyme) [Halalkalibacter nanhaiisediminis]